MPILYLYIIIFLFSFACSVALTFFAIKFSSRHLILDTPDTVRKFHKSPTPLLGGVAVYASLVVTFFVFYLLIPNIFFGIPLKYFLAIFFAGIILMLGGFLDDKFRLKAKHSIIFPILAALCAAGFGVGSGIKELSNPFGQPINLDYAFGVLSLPSIFIFIWFLGMMYTTKFLDGLDGLCAGISAIGGISLFFLSLLPHINQPATAALAIIFSGTLAGFLLFNFHPAKIFLGEGGSTLAGFMLASLSVILGGKIATALLVMGIPILDVAWVIIRRIFYGQSPFIGDRKHLHYKLLDLGLSHRQTVLILWFLSAIFGFSAVFLQTLGKLVALGILFVIMVAMAMLLVIAYKRRFPHTPSPKNID